MGLYKYHGCFFDKEVIKDAMSKTVGFGNMLEKEIEYPHVTIKFTPKDFEVDESLFGEEIQVTIIGYGNNGENEGFLVEPYSDNPEIQEKLDAIKIPHITLSVSATGKPVNTSKLDFYEISPVEISGTYGAYTQEMSLDEPPILKSEVLQRDFDIDDDFENYDR